MNKATESSQQTITAIVIGASMGGFHALASTLSPLPEDFPVPILIVRHLAANTDDYASERLNRQCHLQVKNAQQDEKPLAGVVYIAPADHHMRVTSRGLLQLSKDKKIQYSRPAIDPLFISAAHFYQRGLLAVVLTGANKDGTAGVIEVKKNAGSVMIQDPESAEARTMPESAMAAVNADYTVTLDQIGPMLWSLTRPA